VSPNLKLLPLIPLVLIAGACSRSGKPAEVQAANKRPDPIAISVATAESRKMEKSILVTGSLVADESVVISPEIAGRVTAIRADFGQSVRKGDVVAELDKTEYQIAVERTRAALSQSLARIGLKPGQENIPPTATASTRQSQAQLEDAKFKFESAAKLVKTGDISQERYTELEKAYRARLSNRARTSCGPCG
jgi:multidrug efflux pump subunit AcrA (membrane-fusion protein)